MSQRRELSSVHLYACDDIESSLTLAAIQDTTAQICPNLSTFRFKDIGSLRGAEEAMWYDAPLRIRKETHILFIQYDGFVLNGALWQDSWLQYDYIGAPWPWHSTLRIGNGGFSLRSVRLLRFLSEHQADFPLQSPEDDTLCRQYRVALEAQGFRWAPDHIARDFAFEREAPRPAFGFHGLWHLPAVLPPDEYRRRIALASSYARSKSEWKEMEANASLIFKGEA